jgi:GntR family L-lactate dehydrogenase operon transcriptional regulator
MEMIHGTNREEEEKILLILGQSDRPMGASAIMAALRGENINVSMATAGRFLWNLEQRGYVLQVSNKGRTLSEKGKGLLRQIRKQNEQLHLAENFLHTLEGQDPQKILKVLVARRAIERETSRLAAFSATDRTMGAIFAHAKPLKDLSLDEVLERDRDFHEAIAEAAGNEVLSATLRLVRQDRNIRALLAKIRAEHPQYSLGADHQAIAEAIARNDPGGAEEAMLRHIDNIIGDVRRWFLEENSHPASS